MCIICSSDINNILFLDKIKIENCKNIKCIPKELVNLKSLKIIKCDNLEYIPETLKKLEKLYLHYFNKVKSIPNQLVNLKKIQIDYCPVNQSTIYLISKNAIEIKKIINYLFYS
jgi:hypothetical protein